MTYNDPIEEKEFSFELNFKNDNTGLLQISEPVKFDASTFVVEQDKKRYGRDIFFMNEEISLEFYKDYFTPTTQNVVMPNGTIVKHLTHGFEFLNYYYREFGFESEVEFILKRNGISFITGVLDFATAETDELTFFRFKIIQNTKQAQIKRREDVEIDLFSSEDLDGNAISPLSTTNILLKAKPIVQISEWKSQNPTFSQTSLPGFFISSVDFFNPFIKLIKYKIEDSYIPFETNPFDATISEKNNSWKSFRYLKAKEDLSQIKIEIKGNVNIERINVNGGGEDMSIVCYYSIYYDSSLPSGLPPTADRKQLGDFIRLLGGANTNSYTYNVSELLPDILQGQSLYIYFAHVTDFRDDIIKTTFAEDATLSLKATSTAIDSVIKGVRHIDLIKQTVKSINGMVVNAPKYDVGGAFYDNFVFNGKLIRQFTNDPFYSKFKDAVEQLQELNSDYQINESEIYIGQYNDFYCNNEIGSFLQLPDSDYKSIFNNRYSINTMEYGYKSFEQDRDESNTIDAVHTSTQWLLPNKQVENNLKINVDYVRDPFEIESARRQGINTKETTSLSNDDKIYIIDVVALAPGTRKNFTRVLPYQISVIDNTLKISSSGSFNWTLLGFVVGNVVNVTIGNGVARDYTVTAFESTVITLVPLVGVMSGAGNSEAVIVFDYPLTNVNFVNRTNQEFQNIENVASPDNYSNLQYTIKRNLKYFESYLACASKYKQNGVIKNTYFKSNGNLITEFRNGGDIKENDSFIVANLETRLLEPIIIETKVVVEYDEMLLILQKMQTINTDKTIGGFVRVMDTDKKLISIYPTSISYNWGTKVLELKGEQRYISDTIEISKIDGLIYINQVGYEEQIVKPINIKTSGDFIQLFDFRGVALFNEIKFDKVFVNSNNFSNIIALSEALNSL